jgi:dGTPase
VQLAAFIWAVVEATSASGQVGMVEPLADALASFRSFNYEHVYLRPNSVDQGLRVVRLLRALVEHFADHPEAMLPWQGALVADPGSDGAFRAAVTYVGGMTDRFACQRAIDLLDWPREDLPRGIDLVH